MTLFPGDGNTLRWLCGESESHSITQWRAREEGEREGGREGEREREREQKQQLTNCSLWALELRI